VDASALVEFLLRTGRLGSLEAVVTDAERELDVPALCDIEVVSALRRATAARWLDPDRGEQAIAHYAALPLRRHGHLALLRRVFELRDRFSAYDATYVALAERLGAALLTGDARLARALRGSGDIDVLAVYSCMPT
jgi:predicted nucleic acid-binding protein